MPSKRGSVATPCDRPGCTQGAHQWDQIDHRAKLNPLEPRRVLACQVCGGPLSDHRPFGECFPHAATPLTLRRFLSAGLVPNAPDPARRAAYG